MERKYIIVAALTIQDLIAEVNKALKNGWIPVGGAVPILNANGKNNFMQTLVMQEN